MNRTTKQLLQAWTMLVFGLLATDYTSWQVKRISARRCDTTGRRRPGPAVGWLVEVNQLKVDHSSPTGDSGQQRRKQACTHPHSYWR